MGHDMPLACEALKCRAHAAPVERLDDFPCLDLTIEHMGGHLPRPLAAAPPVLRLLLAALRPGDEPRRELGLGRGSGSQPEALMEFFP